MAIVNRTPDSFFDAGRTFDDDSAHGRRRRAVAAGADIVDIGGVKAGPGEEVDVAEELVGPSTSSPRSATGTPTS